MKIKHLKLAASAAPKIPDLQRPYLNALVIEKGVIFASNGNLLAHIKTNTNIHERVLVPLNAVNNLIKKVGAKGGDREVTIEKEGERIEMHCHTEVEVFTPLEGRYPDFSKLVSSCQKSDDKLDHQFDWNLIHVAHNAMCKYHGRNYNHLYNNKAGGFFSFENEVIYIICSCRV